MSFDILDCAQGSPEWITARLGRLTSSRADDMLSLLKSGKGETAGRRDLRLQLVVERITGRSGEDGYLSRDMQRGLGLELAARAAYEAATGSLVRTVGFLADRVLLAGCSPDGVVGEVEGLLEVKCPRSATHLKYLRAGGVPKDYVPQCTAQLWTSGARWVDFVSFDPLMPERLQLFIARMLRDEQAIAEYEKKALAFLAEVEVEYQAVLTLASPAVLDRTV